jgi:hypothetical protein
MGEAAEPRPATTSKPQFVVSFDGLAFGPDIGAPMPINSKREAVKFGFCGVLPPRRWVQSLHRLTRLNRSFRHGIEEIFVDLRTLNDDVRQKCRYTRKMG